MTTAPHLLVIDDEKDFCDLVVRVGTQLGYMATATSTAGDFKACYQADPPDLIVLDIVMPEQDGIELMRWLVEQGCSARIVIASGYNPVFANAAKMIGEFSGKLSVAFLQKPVKLADLRAQLAVRP